MIPRYRVLELEHALVSCRNDARWGTFTTNKVLRLFLPEARTRVRAHGGPCAHGRMHGKCIGVKCQQVQYGLLGNCICVLLVDIKRYQKIRRRSFQEIHPWSSRWQETSEENIEGKGRERIFQDFEEAC